MHFVCLEVFLEGWQGREPSRRLEPSDIVLVMLSCLFIATLWSPALLALVCDVLLCFVTFPCGILCQAWFYWLMIFATFLRSTFSETILKFLLTFWTLQLFYVSGTFHYILNHTSNAKSNRSFNITYIVLSTVTQFYQKLKHLFMKMKVELHRSIIPFKS